MSDRENPSKLALSHVQEMRGYVPGEQLTEGGWIKINTNENPYPPSPQVVQAMQSFLAEHAASLRLYPNPTSAPLRQAVADFHQLSSDQVIIGNGCDDVLNLLIRAFADRALKVGMMDPSYSLYSVLSNIQATDLVKVPFDRSMVLSAAAIAGSETNIFFLTNPNAPTGVGFSLEQIRQILDAYSGLLVVDETYAPFAREDAVPLLAEYPRLVIVRSFSKAYCLAGMRVGYGLAHAEVIETLDKVRDSYNVDHLSQIAAKAAIEDTEYYSGIVAKNIQLREQISQQLQAYGWFVYPSEANFLFAEPKNAAGEMGAAVASDLFEHLRQHKILVRYFPNSALTQGFLRISVGSDSEMSQLLAIIEQWQNPNHAPQK